MRSIKFNAHQKWGLAIGFVGALMVGVPTYVVFCSETMSKGHLDFALTTFMVGFCVMAIGFLFYQIGDQSNWEIIGTHRDFSFLVNRNTGKRTWVRCQSRLTKNELDWVEGRTEELAE
jgi:hypothetical protein